jgi:PAS domain S-box-containing protein
MDPIAHATPGHDRGHGPAAPRNVLDRWVFPTGVRLWHFIVLPALAMGVFIAISRLIDRALPVTSPPGTDVYQAVRVIIIAVLMSSVIAAIAFRHRREYETRLRGRQRALEATRDFLQSVIDGSGEAIVTLDPEGRMTSWNRAAEQIYGWQSSEVMGRHVEMLLPSGPEATELFELEMDRLRRGEVLRDCEAVRIRKDGTAITVRITRSPVYDASGHYVGSAALIRDVTALKEMEARLLEQQTLAAVGEMSAQVAHEVKNPLMGIRGACEIMSESYGDDHPHREIASEVLRQLDRLNATVEELLAFARPRPMIVVPTDLNEMLQTVLGVMMEDRRSRDVKVDCDLDAGLASVDADPEQIQQVLFNVVLNAMQAMGSTGTLTVRTHQDDGDVYLEIEDTGPGISHDLGEKIFKPFFTTRSKGTGLGLAIVKTIIEAHGGTVTAASAPEGGARFSISLPRATEVPEA